MLQTRLVHRALKYRFRNDPLEIKTMLEHTPRDGVALDIGAHKGAYLWWLARRVGSNGRAIGVEPQTELADRLKTAYAKKPWVSIVNAAVSTESGSATLSIQGEGVSHGATLRQVGEDVKDIRTTQVQTISMSDLIDQQGVSRLDFIKCDAEGFERAIMQAGSDVLDRFRPSVLIECELRLGAGCQDPVGELWDVFRPLGYDAKCFYNGDMIPIDSFEYSTHQRDPDDKAHYGNNFILTHPDGPRAV